MVSLVVETTKRSHRARLGAHGGCGTNRMFLLNNMFVVADMRAGVLSQCKIQLLVHHFSGNCLHTDLGRNVGLLYYNLSSRDKLMINHVKE